MVRTRLPESFARSLEKAPGFVDTDMTAAVFLAVDGGWTL